jgi:hypothetical protein
VRPMYSAPDDCLNCTFQPRVNPEVQPFLCWIFASWLIFSVISCVMTCKIYICQCICWIVVLGILINFDYSFTGPWVVVERATVWTHCASNRRLQSVSQVR